MAKTFTSLNPSDGQVVGRYPIFTAKEVAHTVEQARAASDEWVKLGFSGRKKVLLKWSTFIINNVDQIAQLISLETGKPLSDSRLEVSNTV